MNEQTTMRRPAGQAPLTVTAGVTTGGSLWWLGIVWSIPLLVFGIILAVTSIVDADIGDSLWQDVGGGWQRWVVLGADWSMVPSFAPMLVTHGVTRLRLAQSAAVTGTIVSLVCGLVVVAGYGVEDVVFDANGWAHVLHGGAPAGGTVFLLQVWMEVAVTMAAYFLFGWLLGASTYRHGKESLVFFLLPCAIPAVLVELLVQSRVGSFWFGFLHDVLGGSGEVPAPLGVASALVVLAVGSLGATRLTRSLDLRS